MLSAQEEFEMLDRLIDSYDDLMAKGTVPATTAKTYQDKLDKLATKFQHDQSLGSQRYRLYELQALIDYSRGNPARAQKFVGEAQNLMSPDDSFRSTTLRDIHQGSDVAYDTPAEPGKARRFSGKIEGLLILYAIRLVVAPFYLLHDIAFNQPAPSDYAGLETNFATQLRSYITTATILEGLAVIGFFGAWYLFFSKARGARAYIAGLEIYMMIISFIFYGWIDTILRDAGVSDIYISPITGPLATASFIALLSAAYWIFSRRVKETFVKQG